MANDSKATIDGMGTKELNVGKNIFNITVTAENGVENIYILTITREDPSLSNDATLAALEVSEGTLTPAFSSDTTSYRLTVSNSVASIDITAIANDAEAAVSGDGTKSLVVGENIVNVTVTAENGDEKIYTITVTREPAQPPENKVIVNGVEIPIRLADGVTIIEPTHEQLSTILNANVNEIVFDLQGVSAVDLYFPTELLKDVYKTITIVTANGSNSVQTKALWNDSGKDRLIEVRNGKLSFKNV